MGKITHSSPGTELSLANYTSDSAHLINGVADLNIVRTATYVIATSDAPDIWKAQADEVLIGTTDIATLNTYTTLASADGGGTIVISPGHVYCETSYLPKNYVSLIGQGIGITTLLLSTNRNLINGYDSDTGQHDISIKNLTLDVQYPTYTRFGIITNGYYNIVLDTIEMKNAGFSNLRAYNSHDWHVNRVYSHDFNGGLAGGDVGEDGIAFFSTTADNYNIWVTNCIVSDGGGGGIKVTGAGHTAAYLAHGIWITGCIVQDITQTGIWVTNDLATATRNYDVHIIGNTSINCLHGGEVITTNDSEVIGQHSFNCTGIGQQVESSSRITVADGVFCNNSDHGLSIGSNDSNLVGSDHCRVVNNVSYNNGTSTHSWDAAITLCYGSSYNIVEGNTCYDTNTPCIQPYGIQERLGADYNTIINNELRNNLTANYVAFNESGAGTHSKVVNNNGWISSGEVRSASGSLTSGNANAIGFAWHNPEGQDILIKKIAVNVTTGGGTVGSHLDVGIADDAAGTNRGTEFFNDLLLNTAQVDDSWVAGDGGTQTKWVSCQDSASATDGWVVGQILDANAASLVGSYYIEFVGK